MTGKRLLFITQRFPPDKGGNAARVHDIGANLPTEAWEVTVLAPPPSYPPGEFDRSRTRAETDTVDGMVVHRLWSWQPQVEDPSMLRRLAYYLIFGVHAMVWLLFNRNQYDIVVTTTPPISTGAPGLLAAAIGKPWVVDVRDRWIDASVSLGYLEEGSLVERISRRFQRTVLHTADRITVTTSMLGDSLAASYGESLSDRIRHIPNGVDTGRFQPPPKQTADTDGGTAVQSPTESVPHSPKSSTNQSEQTIIYTGNLGSAQDIESCIQAMSYVETEGVTLQLVGTGDMESDLRAMVEELGLQDSVVFSGLVSRERIPSMLQSATIGIAPLHDADEFAYAMPTKLYEYMACGLPAVVTGRGEIERFVEESGGGVHVPNDPEAIASEFDTLLDADERRRRLGENGRAHVSAYDRKEIARQFSTELTTVLEEYSRW